MARGLHSASTPVIRLPAIATQSGGCPGATRKIDRRAFRDTPAPHRHGYPVAIANALSFYHSHHAAIQYTHTHAGTTQPNRGPGAVQ